MLMKKLVEEFTFNCKVRELAEHIVRNYEKQLSYFLKYLEREHGAITLEEVKLIHIKGYISMLQKRKTSHRISMTC